MYTLSPLKINLIQSLVQKAHPQTRQTASHHKKTFTQKSSVGLLLTLT